MAQALNLAQFKNACFAFKRMEQASHIPQGLPVGAALQPEQLLL